MSILSALATALFLMIGIIIGILILINLADCLFRVIALRMGFYKLFIQYYFTEIRKDKIS